MFERLLTSFQNIFKIPELRTRVLFTLGMLIVYRVGAHIPTPGINGEALSDFLQKQGGALLGFLDIFSGGSLSRLTIFALGIMQVDRARVARARHHVWRAGRAGTVADLRRVAHEIDRGPAGRVRSGARLTGEVSERLESRRAAARSVTR